MLSICIIAVLAFGMVGLADLPYVPSYADDNMPLFDGGDGTPQNPYVIGTTGQLFNMRQFPSASYILENDVVFTDKNFNSDPTDQPAAEDFYNEGNGWDSLFAPGEPFAGTFDGQGYSISGVLSKGTAGWNHRTVFGYSNGVIKNVTLENFTFTMDEGYGYDPGALVAFNLKAGEINNCQVTMDLGTKRQWLLSIFAAPLASVNEGLVTTCSASMNVEGRDAWGMGGLVNLNKGTIQDSHTSGSIQNNSKGVCGVGGIAKINQAVGKITNCTNDLDIANAGFEQYQYVGGIVSTNEGTVTSCYNDGDLFGFGYTGGIAGDNDGSIKCCGNLGSVKNLTAGKNNVDNFGYAGGIAGLNEKNIEESFNNGNVRAYENGFGVKTNAGGIAGQNDLMIKNAYNVGSVSVGDNSLNKRAGGIVGYNRGPILYCYNVGAVNSTTDLDYPDADHATVGAIFGDFATSYHEGFTINCLFLENFTWQRFYTDNDGCEPAAAMMDQYYYTLGVNRFDFDNVWTMEGDPDYPYPELRNAPHRGTNRFLVQFDHALAFDKEATVPYLMLAPGSSIPKPVEPSKAGYAFKGWFEDAAYTTPFNFSTAKMPYWHIKIYGKWEVFPYTVSFDTKGGTTVEQRTILCGEPIGEVQEPTKTGYDFGGWSDKTGSEYIPAMHRMPAYDFTLTAVWIPHTYTLDFYMNDGSDAMMESLPMSYGTSSRLPSNQFNRVGYAFLGWATSPTGAAVYKDKASVNNLTAINGATVNLYAKWGAPISSAVSNSYTSIKVSWTAAGEATSYKIYRATSSSGTYSLVYTAGATARSYVNSGLTTGKTYYYKVYSVAGGKTYAHSTYKYAKPMPGAPTVTLSKGYPTSMKVAWTGVSGGTKYQIYRATGATGTYSLVHTVTSTDRSWANTGLTAGKTYYYKVRAYHLEGTTKVYGEFSVAKYLKL